MMLFFTYNILIHLLLLASLPFLLMLILLKPHHRAGLGQKLGFLPKHVLASLKNRDVIWLHGVSVGEVNSLLPLVEKLKAGFPDMQAVLTVGTRTGFVYAKQNLSKEATVLYFPFDFPWIVSRVIQKIRPRLVIVSEKEFWPNFLRYLKKSNTPVLWVNALVSDHSFAWYRRWKSFWKEALSGISYFAVESKHSKEKLLALGVHPEKIEITGHTKVDQAFFAAPSQEREEIKALLPWLRQKQVLLAASTHEGEEKILCDVFKKINKENPNLLLMLVPRHPERFEKVARLIKTHQLNFIRFSQLNGSNHLPQPEVILIDKLGILKFLYPLAQIAFIGGSLVPVGGHNVWEAAAQGIPILYGRFMKNDYGLPQAGGALQVEDAEQLESSVKDLLGSSEKKALMIRAMTDFIKGHRGASEKNLRLVNKLFQGLGHDSDRN